MILKPYISAILLAAGTSRGMGNVNKLLVKIKGKSILRWSVENVLKSRAIEIFVVIGKDSNLMKKELEGLEVKILLNEKYLEGMSSSIKLGIRSVNSQSDGAIILMADQPNLQAETINCFIEKFYESHKKIIAAHYGNIVGNPVLFHRSLFNELLTIKGDVGARSVLKRHAEEIELVNVSEEEILDLDTPEDFQKLKAIYNI